MCQQMPKVNMTINRFLFGAITVVILLTVLRLFIPYDLSGAKRSTAEIYVPNEGIVDELPIQAILSNNLWDRQRTPLLGRGADGSLAIEQQSTSGGDANIDKKEALRLVGISTSEGKVFAVIEYFEQVELFRMGDSLPDGSKLEVVSNYGVRISKLGEHENFYLFGKD